MLLKNKFEHLLLLLMSAKTHSKLLLPYIWPLGFICESNPSFGRTRRILLAECSSCLQIANLAITCCLLPLNYFPLYSHITNAMTRKIDFSLIEFEQSHVTSFEFESNKSIKDNKLHLRFQLDQILFALILSQGFSRNDYN